LATSAAIAALRPLRLVVEISADTRAQDGGVEGVVTTLSDITERRLTAAALQEAKRQAEPANAIQSRFLAAASHDLREPLQTLTCSRDCSRSRSRDPGNRSLSLRSTMR